MIDIKAFFSSSSQVGRSTLIPMKTKIRSIRFVLSGIAIVAVLITQSAIAQAPAATPHQLVITETPSNSLLVTYDGSPGLVTVVQEAPNAWDLFFPSGVNFPATVPTWVEPESSSLMNELRRAQGGGPILQAASDIAASGHPAANGATVTFGADGGVPISVTFYDHANVANVPETGSTLALLSFALAALFGASRFRALRLA